MRKRLILLAVFIPVVCLLMAFTYNLPPVHDHLGWRVDALVSEIKYALNPPEQVIFVPQDQPARTQLPTPVVRQVATAEPTAAAVAIGPSPTPPASPTPLPTPTPLPATVKLEGVVHEWQQWNNCGPANLAMALSFWGWEGDQTDTAAYLKPNPRDKNVMPYEMANFVNEKTGLKAILRVGGDLERLKALIAAGFPVIVEKGFEGPKFDGWMGHYEVITGYDDAKSHVIAQDSYQGPGENVLVSYDNLLKNWLAFDGTYIVIYPQEREAEVQAILGADWDTTHNYQTAAEKSSQDIFASSGRDQFFAWYNRGTNLMYLQDYTGAADAYDKAFAIYPSIPEKERPWRMVWYQTGPYFAYFFTQRYYDTIALATTTIDTANEPAIEESFFWRGRAFLELYRLDGKQDELEHAVEDFRATLKWHPEFQPSLEQLQALGVTP